ncbi:glutathione S-transferase T3-like [Oryza brachyantha]|uniref:glutathione S-transferase T3-like n=1 Tax=Oryza brachyantha TaxID=4533 RepID=UPI000776126E|nr:glutathione S-transferase T3-like [Oryza brachyantha]
MSTNDPVNIDNDEDDNVAERQVKKKYWSHEEEERLASSWLNASKDPIKGNDRKGDTFWKEVTEEFNKLGNGKYTRKTNQLKVHWTRLKSSTNDFNGFWSTVTKIHTSGYSNNMLEDEAQKMHEQKFGKPFSLVHWWRILKDEPKWCAQFQETDNNKSELLDDTDEPKKCRR